MALRILYAEDHKVLRDHLAEVMVGMGHTVEAVDDGKHVLDLLKSGHKCDVVVTDNQMPNIWGVEVLKQIRAQEEFKKLPVIVLSSMTTIANDVRKLGGIFMPKGLDQNSRGGDTENELNVLRGYFDLIEFLA